MIWNKKLRKTECRNRKKIPTPPANCTKKQNTCRKQISSFLFSFRKDWATTRENKICSESTLPVTHPPLKSVTIRRFYTDRSQSTFMSLTIQPFPRVTSPHAAIIQFGRSIVEVTPWGKGAWCINESRERKRAMRIKRGNIKQFVEE